MPSFPSGLGFAGNPARPLGRDPSPRGTEPARPRPQEISRKEAASAGPTPPSDHAPRFGPAPVGRPPIPLGSRDAKNGCLSREEEEVDASFRGRGLVRGGHLKHNWNNCFL